MWGLGESTPGRKAVRAGDWIAFYKVPLVQVTWRDPPVRLNSSLRRTLDAFQGREIDGIWSWLVQTTRRLSEHDFRKMTGH
jgi:hypothetical protein